MRIGWAAPALSDLAAARAFIALDNPQAAMRKVGLIMRAVSHLAEFPEMARPGRRPGTRELVVRQTPFIIICRRRAEMIEVLRVLHARRLWPGMP